MPVKYTERSFQVCAHPDYATIFRFPSQVRQAETQMFKIHFNCGSALTDKQEELLVSLQEEKITDSPGEKRRLFPCYKTCMHQATLSSSMQLFERRVMGYARGTLYVPHFQEACPQKIAALLLGVSYYFEKESIDTLDYSAGYLPYCSGLFIRKSFTRSGTGGRYRYVPATSTEDSLSLISKGLRDYNRLNESVELRSELRSDRQYRAICQALHNHVISGIEKIMLITGSKPKYRVQHAAANQIRLLMSQYQKGEYYASQELQKKVGLLELRFPCVKKGILNLEFKRLKHEINRAADFYILRQNYTQKINQARRDERLLRPKRPLILSQQKVAKVKRQVSL